MTSVLSIEEKRKLIYVAITRSPPYLHISFIQLRKGEFNPKRRFLNEIG